jgi:hypothetical protein
MSGRIYFAITRKGFATDGTRFQGAITEYSLPDVLNHLEQGDRISMASEEAPHGPSIERHITPEDPTGVRYIFIETGKFAEEPVERREFETVGLTPDVKGWTPRDGNPSYAPGATPWQHPNDPRLRGKR